MYPDYQRVMDVVSQIGYFKPGIHALSRNIRRHEGTGGAYVRTITSRVVPALMPRGEAIIVPMDSIDEVGA